MTVLIIAFTSKQVPLSWSVQMEDYTTLASSATPIGPDLGDLSTLVYESVGMMMDAVLGGTPAVEGSEITLNPRATTGG